MIMFVTKSRAGLFFLFPFLFLFRKYQKCCLFHGGTVLFGFGLFQLVMQFLLLIDKASWFEQAVQESVVRVGERTLARFVSLFVLRLHLWFEFTIFEFEFKSFPNLQFFKTI